MTSDINDGRAASVMQQASHLGAHTPMHLSGATPEPLRKSRQGEMNMEKKTERIKFWLSDKELKELDRQAKKAGMNRSEYIRKKIDESVVIESPKIDYKSYSEEIHKLGNELNRHVIALNTTGVLDEKEVDRIIAELNTVVKKLNAEITEKLEENIRKAKGEPV